MKKKLMFLLCATALLFACNEQDDPLAGIVPEPAAAVSEKGTLVSEEEATAVAEAFFRSQAGEGIATKSEAGLLKSPSSIEAIKEEAGDPLMYVMNYPEGGFALVSASRDYYPVLAYSDEGFFELTPDMGPVEVWIEETKEAFRTKETLDAETKASIRNMWAMLETEGFQMPEASTLRSFDPMADAFGARMRQVYLQYGPQGWNGFYPLSSAQSYFDASTYYNLCDLANRYGSPPQYTIVVLNTHSVTQQVGPLLTTHWHQTYPYNRISYPNNKKVGIGCGPVAMAQIMNFYHSPQTLTYNGYSINWNNMPDGPQNENTPVNLTGDVPYLMSYVKIVSDTHRFLWTTSSFVYPWNVDNTWRDLFYTTTNKPHNANDVKTEILTYERPVMMGGGTLPLPNPLSYIGEGHFWVCDGADDFKQTVTYFVEFINPGNYTYSTQNSSSPSNPLTATTFSRLYFHMNWGWGGSNHGATHNGTDGWFLSNDVNSGNGNYKYGRENFYVHP